MMSEDSRTVFSHVRGPSGLKIVINTLGAAAGTKVMFRLITHRAIVIITFTPSQAFVHGR